MNTGKNCYTDVSSRAVMISSGENPQLTTLAPVCVYWDTYIK